MQAIARILTALPALIEEVERLQIVAPAAGKLIESACAERDEVIARVEKAETERDNAQARITEAAIAWDADNNEKLARIKALDEEIEELKTRVRELEGEVGELAFGHGDCTGCEAREGSAALAGEGEHADPSTD